MKVQQTIGESRDKKQTHICLHRSTDPTQQKRNQSQKTDIKQVKPSTTRACTYELRKSRLEKHARNKMTFTQHTVLMPFTGSACSTG